MAIRNAMLKKCSENVTADFPQSVTAVSLFFVGAAYASLFFFLKTRRLCDRIHSLPARDQETRPERENSMSLTNRIREGWVCCERTEQADAVCV